jgi:hypothetical protein
LAPLPPLQSRCYQLAAAERKRFKIRQGRTATLRGSCRTYVLVKVLSAAGRTDGTAHNRIHAASGIEMGWAYARL